MIDIRGENLFEARGGSEMGWNAIRNWADARGEAGVALTISLAIWLLIRLGTAKKRGGIKRMLLTEAGWAAFAAGLLFISHREGTGAARLWPTETTTDGAQGIALFYGVAAIGGLTGMIASWKWARKRAAAILLSALLFAGPWLFKAVCADMSVKEWRAASILIFRWLIILLPFIWKSRGFGLFVAECRQAEEQGILSLAGRRIWYALTLAAAVHFMLGVFLSGQELISLYQQIHIEEGAAESFGIDEEWIEEVQALREEYLLSGQAEDVLRKAEEDGEKDKAKAVRWMENNEIEQLTEEMFVTVKFEGEIILRQTAKTRMILTLSESDTVGYAQQLFIEAPWSESGKLECATVVLLAPGEALPLLERNVEIEQPSLSWLASQKGYRLEMGNVTMQDIEDVEEI